MPILLAIKSPIDLVIANPGVSVFSMYTLKGPISMPFEFYNLFKTPPFFNILYYSSGISALCSYDSYTID